MNLVLLLLARLTSQRGQTMAEYGVLIAWVALLVIVGVSTLGHSLTTLFSSHRDQGLSCGAGALSRAHWA